MGNRRTHPPGSRQITRGRALTEGVSLELGQLQIENLISCMQNQIIEALPKA
jgi:hypothetical protein